MKISSFKRILWSSLFIALLSLVFSGCSPQRDFTGAWTTNVGKVTFAQNGNSISGVIHGYGGVTHQFQGTANQTDASFSTDWFGDFTLVLSGNTFKNKSADLSFCGIRSSSTDKLPDGCGFSGNWRLSKAYYQEGSTMALTQTAENISGKVFDANKNQIDTITGQVSWGKGWQMNGVSANFGQINLMINSSETGFVLDVANLPPPANMDSCAVRSNLAEAYLFSYTCKP